MKIKYSADIADAGVTREQFDSIVKAAENLYENVIKPVVDGILNIIETVTEVVNEIAVNVLDATFKSCTSNPKWYNLYKHAKRQRTRNKYRKKLIEETLNIISGYV